MGTTHYPLQTARPGLIRQPGLSSLIQVSRHVTHMFFRRTLVALFQCFYNARAWRPRELFYDQVQNSAGLVNNLTDRLAPKRVANGLKLLSFSYGVLF